MKALAPITSHIFDKVCKLNCIKDYWLVGGTALAIQLQHRLSEDLDFMCWKTIKHQKSEVDWVKIEKELSSIGKIEAREIWDFDHVEFIVSGVKFSFYASAKYSPITSSILHKDNLQLADVMSIAAMKMEVLLRRSNFRDYYDIYSILINGYDFKEIIARATTYSGHLLSTKNLLAMLVDSKRFKIDNNFKLLEPKYPILPADIEAYLKIQIKDKLQSV